MVRSCLSQGTNEAMENRQHSKAAGQSLIGVPRPNSNRQPPVNRRPPLYRTVALATELSPGPSPVYATDLRSSVMTKTAVPSSTMAAMRPFSPSHCSGLWRSYLAYRFQGGVKAWIVETLGMGKPHAVLHVAFESKPESQPHDRHSTDACLPLKRQCLTGQTETGQGIHPARGYRLHVNGPRTQGAQADQPVQLPQQLRHRHPRRSRPQPLPSSQPQAVLDVAGSIGRRGRSRGTGRCCRGCLLVRLIQ